MRGFQLQPIKQSKQMTFTKSFLLKITPDPTTAALPATQLELLRDEAMSRLEGALFSLINQGIFSGSFIFQNQLPPATVHWSISIN